MWIKKTEKELRDYKEPIINRLFNHKIIVFLILIPVLVLIEFLIVISYGEGHALPPSIVAPLDFNDAINRIPYFFVKDTILVIVIYAFFFLILKIDKNEKSGLKYVCDKCNKLTDKVADHKCDCGGEFIHINKMKWIDDK